MRFHSFSRGVLVSFLCTATFLFSSPAQQAPKKSLAKSSPESEVPAQIELLETRVRFETNGDSRKEVHARVHILNELGAQQFGRLAFDYNRAFQSVEIPQAHISHPEGGTSDILPSAITDRANPATEGAPAYQDVRVKSVRILGLSPGDTLEYRAITTTTHHPLAPDFWFDHNFDRSGVVASEIFDLDLSASRAFQKYVNPKTPITSAEQSGAGDAARVTFHWQLSEQPALGADSEEAAKSNPSPDVVVTTFESWSQMAVRLSSFLVPSIPAAPEIHSKALSFVSAAGPKKNPGHNPDPRIQDLYDFVSQKIRTVDLPLGATGFRTRPPAEILASGYASPEDKLLLFAALASDVVTLPHAALVLHGTPKDGGGLARPTVFDHLLAEIDILSTSSWVDLNLEVAPCGMIPLQFRGQAALLIAPAGQETWHEVSSALPYASTQKVSVDGILKEDGKLTAKVHYSLRGDNELLLRVAFHQTPKEKWKELAQLLSLSDGFRGQVSSVNASDPSATREPFSLDYEITEPKFLDWSKKPLHVPALLPQLGLPDPPGKTAAGATPPPLELGTPLEAEIRMTLHLPPGSTISAPTGTSVQRDYATFSSRYSAEGQTATAVRRIRFIARQLPADRAFDLNAFLRAVQTDEGQTFLLDRQNAQTPASTSKP